VSGESFLSRWSRRKSVAKTAAPLEQAAEPPASAAPVLPIAAEPVEDAPVAGPAAAPEPLPPVESLTPESDFTAFMKPEVDPSLRRQAFKKLIEDPRYNVMDGLDVYIDDYSRADPLPEGWLEKMSQVRYLGIFKEEAEKGDAEKEGAQVAPAPRLAEQPASAEPEALPAPMQDTPVSFPPPPAPADTSGEENLPAEVGKSQGMKGGS
jgi:hypothetical protein